MWFSNWLVSAPSIVQCPELCTRGAISFASEFAADVEQLDAAHADVVEVVEQRPDRRLGARLECVVEAGRGREREPEDAVAVMVLDRGPARDLAVAAAHGDDRELPVEGDEAFEDARAPRRAAPSGVDVGRRSRTTAWPLPS